MCVLLQLRMSILRKLLRKDVFVKIYIIVWIRCLFRSLLCVSGEMMCFCCSVNLRRTLRQSTGCRPFSWRRMRRKNFLLIRGPETCASWRISPSRYLLSRRTGRLRQLFCKPIFPHRMYNVCRHCWEHGRAKALRANGKFFIPFCSICVRKWPNWGRWCTTWWLNVQGRWHKWGK